MLASNTMHTRNFATRISYAEFREVEERLSTAVLADESEAGGGVGRLLAKKMNELGLRARRTATDATH